jgi:hypothetical protein
MQTHRTPLTQRLADAADLIIDFATLGEYGLEPVPEPQPVQCRPGRRRTRRFPVRSHGDLPLATAQR